LKNIVSAFCLLILLLGCASSTSSSDPAYVDLFKRLTAQADKGNPEVEYHLGMFYNNGLGTARDNHLAYQYFSKAAEKGNALAAYKVGCYLDGQFPGVVPIDTEQALKYKLIAAEAGYSLAQLEVGSYFGKKGDIRNAVVWWERAARQGNFSATAYLAHYFSGPESPDRVKGLELLLLMKERMPQPTKELVAKIATVQENLSAQESADVERRRALWTKEPTSLSMIAAAGAKAAIPLLESLEK
jgi:uncharacterized protein